jgi:hypothetical protein
MAISGDTKENYIQLQQSTGETFESMADRISAPEYNRGLDEAGRKGNLELAEWLRRQSDDSKALDRFKPAETPSTPKESVTGRTGGRA